MLERAGLPASFFDDEQPTCHHLGRVLGQTACTCGSGAKSIDVHECLAGHGLNIRLTDGVKANACQLANHQKPHAGKWRLARLPSCSTCEFHSRPR